MQAEVSVIRSHWLPFRNVLVDFRVVISTVLFAVVVMHDMATGWKPRPVLETALGLPGAIGLLLVLAGVAVRSWAAGVLVKGRQLAIGGPYSLCRHPLYLGSFLMMFGFCRIVGDPVNFFLIVLPMVAVYTATMLKEEQRMTGRYGRAWTCYAAETPRLLPWRWSGYVGGGWSVRQWLRNREYQALSASLAGLLLLEVWRRV